MDDSKANFAKASMRGQRQLATVPTVVSARFDRRVSRVVLALSNGLELALRPKLCQDLAGASVDQLSVIEITGAGFGIHFPALDADLYVPLLLQGSFGTRKWMDGVKLVLAQERDARSANPVGLPSARGPGSTRKDPVHREPALPQAGASKRSAAESHRS